MHRNSETSEIDVNFIPFSNEIPSRENGLLKPRRSVVTSRNSRSHSIPSPSIFRPLNTHSSSTTSNSQPNQPLTTSLSRDSCLLPTTKDTNNHHSTPTTSATPGLVNSAAAAAVKGLLRIKSSSAASFRRRRPDLRISIPEEPDLDVARTDAQGFFTAFGASGLRSDNRKVGVANQINPPLAPSIALTVATPLVVDKFADKLSDESDQKNRTKMDYSPAMSVRSTSSFRDLHQHSFLVDETDLRRMENGLLHLLEDFTAGKLRAFVANQTLDKMKQVRDQQETLAKLHFELYTEQEQIIDEGNPDNIRYIADNNLKKLTDGLKDLNEAIRELCNDEMMR